MSKKFQKVVSLTTSVTTIVWLSGIAALAPMSAMAATIVEGDTIKTADNPDVYIAKYVGAKKFKRLILNPQVFNSYGHLSWSKIKTVTQAEMDVFTTSDLVRALGDSKVYKLIPNGDVGTKQWVNMTAEAFTAAGYDWDSIYVINNTDRDNYTVGSDITGGTSTSPSTSASATAVSGSVTVSLASDTPAAATILSDGAGTSLDGQALIPALKLNFTAPSDGAVTVTTLKLTRSGISADSDLDNVYLYDGDNIIGRLAEMQSISSKIITFSNSNGLFTVPAGSTKTILVRFDLNREATSGKTISVALNAAGDVSSNAGSVSGSFPLSSNVFTTATATDFGAVKIAVVAGGNSSSVDPGTTGFTAGQYQVTPANQSLQLKYLKFQMVGSATTNDITNVKLYDGATQIGSVAQLDADKYVTFDLTSSPLAISSSQVKNLYLKADVVGGSTRTFKFYLQKGSDAIVYDTGYGIYLRPYSSSVGSFSAQATTEVTIGSGAITSSKATDSPNTNIADAATGLTFAKFALKATGENIKISSLSYYCYSSDAASYIDNVKILVDDVQQGTTDATILCDTLVTETATTTVNFTVNAGTTSYVKIIGDTTDTTVGVDDTYKFTLSIGVDNGQQMSSLGYIDVPSAGVDGNLLTIKSGTVVAAKNAGFGDATVANPTGVVGRNNVKIGSFTVKAGAGEDVDISKITLKEDGTYDLGPNFQNLKIMHGSTQFGSTIGTLQTDSTSPAYTYEFSPASALRIANGQTEIFDVYADILTNAADTAKTDMEIIVDSVTATGVSTAADASDTTSDPSLQNIYIAASGTLLIENVPTSSQVQAQAYHSSNTSTNEVELYKFKLTAYTEAIDITRVIVNDTIKSEAYGATTTSGKPTTTFSLFKLYKGSTLVGSATLYSTSTPVNGGYIDFNIGSASPIALSAGEEATFTLKGVVNSYDQISSGSTHKFSLQAANTPIQDATTDAITALGHDSNVDKSGPTSTLNGNEITIRKSYPVVERIALPTTTLASGTSDGVSVAKFKVSAVGGEVRLKKMTFNVTLTDSTTSTALSLSAFKLYRNGSLAGTTEYDIFDGTGSGTGDQLSSTGTATLSTDALKGDLGAANSTNTKIVLSFAPVTEVDPGDNGDGEEIIASGDSNTYEIKCTITNAHTGASTDADSIVVQLLGDDGQTQPYTGNISRLTATTDDFGVFGLNSTNYYFIWSDYSANIGQHVDDIPSSSCDWTHGYQVRKDTSSVSFIPLDSWSLTK